MFCIPTVYLGTSSMLGSCRTGKVLTSSFRSDSEQKSDRAHPLHLRKNTANLSVSCTSHLGPSTPGPLPGHGHLLLDASREDGRHRPADRFRRWDRHLVRPLGRRYASDDRPGLDCRRTEGGNKVSRGTETVTFAVNSTIFSPRTPAHRLLRNPRVTRKRLLRRERKAQIQVVSVSEEDIKSLAPVN